MRPDVLLVQPGTTAGWRRGDSELREALERLGLEAAVCGTDFRVARHLRRGVLATDLAEAAAMRHALTRSLRRMQPRAILYSSSQATMLQPRARLEGATAVRFDVPAALNRRGPGTALLHALERRALGRVRLLLPIGIEPQAEVRTALPAGKPVVALPIPLDVPVAVGERERLALAYAGNPEKKGLDLLAAAWSATDTSDWRLVVTGLEREAGRRFLARRGVAEPEGLEWAGVVDRTRYVELLSRASVFISASRYEDYGIAQLEALAAGAMLVTVPSGGPYEALRYARELDGRLVAEELSALALSRALAAAIRTEQAERLAYSGRARSMMQPHSRAELDRRLAERVIPALLS